MLGEGEKKIEENVYSGKVASSQQIAVWLYVDMMSGMSNTSDFVLNKEDHTLGNLLAEHLKAHPNVYMAGYKRTSSTRGSSMCRDASFLTWRSRPSQRATVIHPITNGRNQISSRRFLLCL